MLGALVAALVLAGVGAFALWPRPGASRANFDRLRVGMSQGEVTGILGVPPGDSGSSLGARVVGEEVVFGRPWLVGGGYLARWHDENGTVHLSFDADGRVMGGEFWPSHGERQPGPRDGLRRLWRRGFP